MKRTDYGSSFFAQGQRDLLPERMAITTGHQSGGEEDGPFTALTRSNTHTSHGHAKQGGGCPVTFINFRAVCLQNDSKLSSMEN